MRAIARVIRMEGVGRQAGRADESSQKQYVDAADVCSRRGSLMSLKSRMECKMRNHRIELGHLGQP